ncbi:glycosyltransferase [Cetobacterium somerae]|uniref:glycosyltransferase n=1 Tax=Cetobacterium somerae TaxID=188913 RepID=UPI00248EA467|nr:glycosyltransferase [Cetobacterium somerae]
MKISVVVLTYNHEKYLVECIESILNQELDCEYEVLIGNDKSPDNTKKVLEKYKTNEKIKIFNREENLGATKNLVDLLQKSQGEYIALLEGDDYWIDNKKLSKQINILEENKEYILCMTQSLTVDENSKIIGEKQIDISKIDSIKKLFFYRGGIPTGTVVFRNIFRNIVDEKAKALLTSSSIIGDLSLFSYLINYGKFYNLKEKTGAYRYVTNSGTSYSAMNSYKQELELEKVVKEILNFDKTDNKFLELYLNRIQYKLLKSNWRYLKILSFYGKINIFRYIIFLPYYNLKYSNIKKEVRKNEKNR